MTPALCGWHKETKMPKTIVAPLSCANDFASEIPESLFVTFQDETIEKIRNLAKLVNELDGVCFELALQDGIWSDADENELSDEMGFEQFAIPQNVDYESLKSHMLGHSNRVDAPVIRVYPHSFSLSAVPRNCSSNFTVTTKVIPLQFLEGPEPLNIFAKDLQS